MRKGLLKVASLLAIAGAVTGFAALKSHELCDGFLPENTMKIPVGAKPAWNFRDRAPAGLTEQQFNEVMDRAEKLYAPVIAKAGGTLRVNRLWNDATVNASAQQQGGTWIVNMYGGLARHPATTKEGMALVICHELGHHLGGAPKTNDWWGGMSWATNEGGADYFATLKCLRNYFAEDDNETIIASAQIDAYAKTKCEAGFSTRADQLICERTSMAGTSVAYLFMDLRKEATFPKFDTPDKKVVTEMYDDHPATQCRMDTYFAGTICHVDKSVAVSDKDYHEGSCSSPNDTEGMRPLCWFKP